jgi:hypothetical protein
MITEPEMQEYLDEIRQEVCSRCVEGPDGGPPCAPLGKRCGVELHLPELVKAVQQVHSELIEPYLNCNRQCICSCCPYLHSDSCPCPMDTLAVLVVEAIEAVDRRRAPRERARQLAESLPGLDRPGLKDILRSYEEAAGTWTGCDWPTVFGPAGLNLEGWTAAEAETQAVEVDRTERPDWEAAAEWLELVEQRAEQAETEAEQAVKAASTSSWSEAAFHAHLASALEFSTGRPFRRQPATWQHLDELVAAAARAQNPSETVAV